MAVYLRAQHPTRGLVRGVAEAFQFPGGEWHLRNIHPFRTDADVTWIADVRGASLDDLAIAALLADVAHYRQEPFVLMLPYLPAARADRGVPEGARVYADLVRSMNPQQVIGIDPHSPRIGRYLPKLTALSPTALAGRALDHAGHMGRYDGVIAPDKGAYQRAFDVALNLDLDLYRAEKKRDFETGRLLAYEMTEYLPKSGRYLVVDDICDGGGTFKMLANETGLHSAQLGLWVTHGIFSGAANELRKYYRHIYTTDSHPGRNRAGCATVIVPTETYMLENVKKVF